jgi:hypothetical protein
MNNRLSFARRDYAVQEIFAIESDKYGAIIRQIGTMANKQNKSRAISILLDGDGAYLGVSSEECSA